ncbi:hypothetical protein JG688_00016625 [Phytophthora aleatoria]|uniref:Uncharacterized protein n=1 Tax=Phytophthora aleatoria TaxID=2496075 RepID=A0A8J5ITT5_9STRA|nr:hypothetical protein JG688_00016625 [Phytophthora aleatoria]
MAAAAETGPSRSDKAAGGAVKDAGAAVEAATGSATIRRFLWRRVSAAGTADLSASFCVRSCAVPLGVGVRIERGRHICKQHAVR